MQRVSLSDPHSGLRKPIYPRTELRSSAGVSPSMVAVPVPAGSRGLGEANSTGCVGSHSAIRGSQDLLGLTVDNAFEAPPEVPEGSCQELVDQCALARDQHLDEGNQIWEVLYPTVDLSGLHSAQDTRRLENWKRGTVKDGRAFLRWALTFVDRSGIEGQSKLLTEINDMKLSASGNLFALEEHLYKLYDLWLALSGSRKDQPAHLPDNSGIVHVRRYLADLLEKDESPLLKKNYDDDGGLFEKLIKYAETLGLKHPPAASLHYQEKEKPPAPAPAPAPALKAKPLSFATPVGQLTGG
eukprot:scaffold110641_cov36-Phaeocystis_antarctica.AAC.1